VSGLLAPLSLARDLPVDFSWPLLAMIGMKTA
jgi:hypothetical protein